MPLTLQQAFGENATLTNGILYISLADYPKLNSANPSASQVLAAILLRLKTVTQPLANDSTVGVVAAEEFGNEKSFVIRGEPPIATNMRKRTNQLFFSPKRSGDKVVFQFFIT
jgi:hypothetical protein